MNANLAHCMTLAASLALCTACDRAPGRKASTGAPAAATSQSGRAGGISGTVRLKGPVPARQAIETAPCHAGAAPLFEEKIVADSGGRLKNVVVSLVGVSAQPARREAATLDQKDCRFEPHVVALSTGQTLRVKTSDPALHNVHTTCEKNPMSNRAMLPGAPPVEMSFNAPETFAVKCDVHPWMRAYIAVFDHPYFSVTGADGRFELKDVPPGKYHLTCWQESLGKVGRDVTVNAGQVAPADVSY